MSLNSCLETDFKVASPSAEERRKRFHSKTFPRVVVLPRSSTWSKCPAGRTWKGMIFHELCVELKFSGSQYMYMLGPTGFLWHVRRFASASYGGHLSGPKWLPLKACPHVRSRSTHPTKAERERELCLCVWRDDGVRNSTGERIGVRLDGHRFLRTPSSL